MLLLKIEFLSLLYEIRHTYLFQEIQITKWRHVNKFKFVGATPLFPHKKKLGHVIFVTKHRHTYNEMTNVLINVTKIDLRGRCYLFFSLHVND